MMQLVRRYPGPVFALLVAAYMAMQVGLGRFVQMDEVFFKAAGREWASSGRFAAPEIQGVPTADPPGFLIMTPPLSQVWFAQPPGYTFLFGFFAWILGFGPTQCVAFDALIHACLATVTFLITRILAPANKPWPSLAAGLLVLPLGTLARPDELGMCQGMLGILILLGGFKQRRRVIASGGLFGLCSVTSPGAAILLGLVAACVWLVTAWSGTSAERATISLRSRTDLRRCVRTAIVWGASAAVIAGLAILPILAVCPQAWHQFAAHAGGHFWHGRYAEAFTKTWDCGKPYLAVALAGLGLGGLTFLRAETAPDRVEWLRLWLGPVAGFLFLAAFLPDKYLYTWFVGPWILAVTAAQWPRIALGIPRPVLRALCLVFVFAYAVAASPFVQSALIMMSLPQSQSLARNAALVRAVIPANSRVMTDDLWWELANRCHVCDPYFSRPTGEELDYVILGGDGLASPGVRRALPPQLAHGQIELRCLLDTVGGRPLSLFGKPLPNTAYGFGVTVLAIRRPALAADAWVRLSTGRLAQP